MDAYIRKPTGFSDPEFHCSTVHILGYCYGHHRDANGYNRAGNCVLAICAHEDGGMEAVPLHWLSARRQRANSEDGRDG